MHQEISKKAARSFYLTTKQIYFWMAFTFFLIFGLFCHFQVPSNNNEDSTKTAVSNSNSSPWSLKQASDLSSQVQELHDAITRLKKESEDQIQRIKRESEEKTKEINALRMKVDEQRDYEMLKREVQ